MKKITMLSILITSIFLFGVLGNTSEAENNNESKKSLTKQEMATIEKASRIGQELYEKDMRAAKASDLVLGAIKREDYPDFAGWVTHKHGKLYTVSFYEKKDNIYSVFADVEFDKNDKPTVVINPDRKLDETEISKIRARVSGLQRGFNSCSNRFNTIVMPSDNPDAWDVYVLAATDEAGLVVAGGHRKIVVDKKTGEVLQQYAFSKSCLNIDKTPDDLPAGAEPAALTLTHIIDVLPAETHVYMSLLHDITFFVITDKGMWNVTSGKITYEGGLSK
jgi:hypothetical protein